MPSTEPAEVVLRPATPDDVAELLAVYAASRAAAPMPAGDDHALVALGALDWFGHGYEVWLAERDATDPDEPGDPDEPDEAEAPEVVGLLLMQGDWLHSLYVVPEAQRLGVGSALLDVARALRPGGFGLWCFAQNAPARAFYRAHGLLELETTDGAGNDEATPDVRVVWPGADPVAWLRAEIDDVDTEIARLVARRVALTAAVQPFKPVPGHAGRDPQRESAIAERMSTRGPGPDPAAYARLVDLLVGIGLDRYEQTVRSQDAG